MSEIEKIEALSLETLAQLINIEHRAFIGSAKKTFEHGIRAGELLAQAKGQCKHGEWLGWLEENFVGAPRTAQGYMRLHKHRDEVLANTREHAHLTIDGALRSIAEPKPSEATPTPGVVDVVAAPLSTPSEANGQKAMGAIAQIQASPEGREAFAEINQEFDDEGTYLKIRSKINDLFWMARHMPPEDAARREFAHHAADIARDVVLERRSFNRIFQIEEAEALREWLGSYVQSLKDAEARLYEHTKD